MNPDEERRMLQTLAHMSETLKNVETRLRQLDDLRNRPTAESGIVRPRATKSRNFEIAFLLSEEIIRNLSGILRSISEDIEYTVNLADGTTRHCSTLEEVMGIPNTQERSVTSMYLSTGGGQEAYARIGFHDRKFSTVEYDIAAENERDVVYISDRLEEVIGTARPWYSRISFLNVLSFFLVTFLGSAMVLVAYLGVTDNLPVEEARTGDRRLPPFALAIILGVVLLVVFAEGLRDRTFPRAAFLVGDGIRRNKSVVFWRRTVGATFGLSLLASLVVSLLTK